MHNTTRTRAKILSADDISGRILPEEYVRHLGSKHIVLIYDRDANFMKMVPVDKDDVYVLMISTMVTKDSIRELMRLFARSGLNSPLLRTDPHLDGEMCRYESYFRKSELSMDIDEIREKMLGIDGVEDVIIEQVQ